MPSKCAHKPHRHERLERSLLHWQGAECPQSGDGALPMLFSWLSWHRAQLGQKTKGVSFTKMERVGGVERKRNSTPHHYIGKYA